jgi:low affinity Fe/Cu permease
VQETQVKELKKNEQQRGFLCVVSDAFRVFARRSSMLLGSAWAFAGAVLVIVVWILTGPTFHFSDTWQLIINTATTVITFLMVFLIQNTQNRDAKAVHLKLDEIIRALEGARNQLVDLEDLSDEELKKLEEQFQRLRKMAERNGTRSRKGRPLRPAENKTRKGADGHWQRSDFVARLAASSLCSFVFLFRPVKICVICGLHDGGIRKSRGSYSRRN